MRIAVHFLVCCFSLLAGGCAPLSQAGGDRRLQMQNRISASAAMNVNAVDAAMAEALSDQFLKTQVSDRKARKRRGTLFLSGASPQVAVLMKTGLGRSAPSIDADSSHFHEYRDIRTGKGARLMVIKTISQGPGVIVFRVMDADPLGGEETRYELHLVSGKWEVGQRRVEGIP